MATDENSWKTESFRQILITKIDETVQSSRIFTSRNSINIENQIFQRAKTREEYLSLVAKLILYVRKLNSERTETTPLDEAGSGNQGVPGPIEAIQTLTRQRTNNNQITNIGGPGPNPQGIISQSDTSEQEQRNKDGKGTSNRSHQLPYIMANSDSHNSRDKDQSQSASNTTSSTGNRNNTKSEDKRDFCSALHEEERSSTHYQRRILISSHTSNDSSNGSPRLKENNVSENSGNYLNSFKYSTTRHAVNIGTAEEQRVNYSSPVQLELPGSRRQNTALVSNVRVDRHASNKKNNDVPNGYNDSRNNFLCQKQIRICNAPISNVRVDRKASNLKNNDLPNECNDSRNNSFCQKQIRICNTVTKTLKHHVTTKTMDLDSPAEPTKVSVKIYDTQSKEELHVPKDVATSKEKSLEVCMTLDDDDEKTENVESTDNHDSINQEIHHSKLFKAIPRTALKIPTDEKQIDSKLIKVSVLEGMSNVIPKPPTQTHSKRTVRYSWNAFQRKNKQRFKEKEAYKKETERIEQKPLTPYNQPQIIFNKLMKVQKYDNAHKLDSISKVLFDTNKNYAKAVNRRINGTKTGKKLIFEKQISMHKVRKVWKPHVKNGRMCKSNRQRNLRSKQYVTKTKYVDETETRNSASSSASEKLNSPGDEDSQVQLESDNTMEDISGRIKKKRIIVDKKNSNEIFSLNLESQVTTKENTEKRLCRKENPEYKKRSDVTVMVKRSMSKCTRDTFLKSKQRKVCRSKQSNADNSEKSDASVSSNCNVANSGLGRFLATLQTILGIAITALSLWLLLWTPHLPVTDNPYWSGMPLLLSGSFGICLLYCFNRECPGMSAGFCFSTTKVSSVLLAILATATCAESCVCTRNKRPKYMQVRSNPNVTTNYLNSWPIYNPNLTERTMTKLVRNGPRHLVPSIFLIDNRRWRSLTRFWY